MYTIKQASIRTGVSVPLLRAWERRYGIPHPARTTSGYRLYDDAALEAVRQMRQLVAMGWPPSQAAHAVVDGSGRAEAPDPAAPDRALVLAGLATDSRRQSSPGLVERFVAAAVAVDETAIERVLDESFAALGVDEAIRTVALPGLVAVGEAWSSGALDVAGEHAASEATMRRLGALYEAAGQPAGAPQVIVGLPPGGRHEAGALAFAVACRRAGIRVLYLGADVPADSWRRVAQAWPDAAIVLAAVTGSEAVAAGAVVSALRDLRPALVAVGGSSAGAVRGEVVRLPDDVTSAVATVGDILAAGPGPSPR